MAGPSNNHQRGFSLLEVMVVLFIIGMLIGLVSIKAFNFEPDAELQDYGEDLFAQLQFGSDEALFGGEHIGLVPSAYNAANGEQLWQLTWHRWRDGQWQVIQELAPIKPPEFTTLAIEIDNQQVDLWRWLEFDEPLPVIMFYAGGEALAATVIVSLTANIADQVADYQNRQLHMEINELGAVTWVERSQQEQTLASQ